MIRITSFERPTILLEDMGCTTVEAFQAMQLLEIRCYLGRKRVVAAVNARCL